MKKIWIIPPVPKENKKIRVAAYCRVGTFRPAQLHSFRKKWQNVRGL